MGDEGRNKMYFQYLTQADWFGLLDKQWQKEREKTEYTLHLKKRI